MCHILICRTPVRKQPVVCGKPVDLYELYQYVKENGGYRKVNLCVKNELST